MTDPTTPSPERQPADAGGERDAFESWYCQDAAKLGLSFSPSELFNLREGEDYGSNRVAINSKWKGWQGRAALSTPAPTQSAAQTGEACRCSRCVNEAVAAEGGSGFDTRLMQMFLCTQCGNKRCPHATDHRLSCTNSNEAGQEGSSYGPPLYRRDQATLIEAQAAEIEGLKAALRQVEPANDVWWKTVIGETHTPSGEGISIKHLHPLTVKPFYDQHKGTALGDIIAGLIFDASITRNREQFLVADAYERARTAEEAADRLLEENRAFLASRTERAAIETTRAGSTLSVAERTNPHSR